MKIGDTVWTTTLSGERFECTVVGFEFGQVVLDSPTHGYIIYRYPSETILGDVSPLDFEETDDA